MKTFSILARLLPALALSFSPLCAQSPYNPPPPPEEQSQGPVTPPPGPDDPGAPPMDPNAAAPDQPGAPPDAGEQGAPPDQAGGDAGGDVNFQTFYDSLSAQGSWVQTDTYGYVWQPEEEDPSWAPYTNGRWVYTDEGWTWIADESEPWGWATYHYGRWVNLDGTGWVWVPGYTWAPAWVSWRYGDGYCGWAPIPPGTFAGIDFNGAGYGFHIGGDCDTAYGIGPGSYHFVPIGYLGARNYRGHYLNPVDNFTIINHTRNVTNIVVNSQVGAGRFGRVHVGGPSLATVNAQAQTPVPRVTLARSSRAGTVRLSGDRLAVFAPRVATTTAGFHPRAVAGELRSAGVNRGAVISQPLAGNARASTAPVATFNTRPTEALTQPPASLQPHNEHDFAPPEEHVSAPVVHQPAEVQHQDFHPEPPTHASVPAQHPAAADNHGDKKDNDKKDKKKDDDKN